MSAQVAGLVTAARAARLHWAKVKPALDAVARNPADAVAALDAGRYHCLVKGDWPTGLPLLARCADPAIRAAAEADLTASADPAVAPGPARLAAIARLWWDLAGSSDAAVRPRLQERAAHWYRQAAPNLAGVARTQAEQRGAIAGAAGGPKLEPGLTGEVFWDPALTRLVRVRVDPVVSAEYAAQPPDPSLSDGVFGVRWTGFLKVNRTGNYTLVVRVRESVRIWIDGQSALACNAPSDAFRQKVSLTEGLHAIRIHYNSRGGKSRLNLGWSLENGFAEQLIPPTALLHDPAQGAESMRLGGAGGTGGSGGGLMPYLGIVRTAAVRSSSVGRWFDDLAPDAAGVLIGLRVGETTFAGRTVIRTVQPVYRTESGDVEDGEQRGIPATVVLTANHKDGTKISRTVPTSAVPANLLPPPGAKSDLIAKDGYAVAGVTARSGARLDGLSVTFMRLKPDGTLDPRDTYKSPWVGGQGGEVEQTVATAGNKPALGLHGRTGNGVYALGLVQRK
jgi:hypothetical protein